MTRYRVKVLERPDSSKYLVNRIVKSKLSPRMIVAKFLEKYPDVHMIEAKEDTPFRIYGYSISSNAG